MPVHVVTGGSKTRTHEDAGAVAVADGHLFVKRDEHIASPVIAAYSPSSWKVAQVGGEKIEAPKGSSGD